MAHTDHHGTQALCPACDTGPFIRNHYFTGKLMLERDFSDETRFHMEKLRHHHQRLHGWGVVCGLKVKQHEREECRDRFICIEAGTAIDCCGHEIVVREEECIDITQLEKIKALKKKEADNPEAPPSTIQICIRYRECPTEEIPVLYDECGCDETKCAPNRILESYEIDVIVGPPDEKPHAFHTPKFKWENSVAIAHAARVAVHDATHRLYVVTANNPSTVYQVSTDNHITITSSTLATQAVALAVSNDGAHLYVITEPANPTDPRQLHVLDTTKAGLPPIHPSSSADLGGGAAFMTVAPDKRLLALGGASGNVLRWAIDIDTPGATPAPPQKLTLTANVAGLVLSKDGATGYVADTANEKILRFNATALTSGTPITLPGVKPSLLAIVKSTASDRLVVVDQTNSKLHLIALAPTASVVGSVKLDHPPIGVVAAPGGHWAYVLEKDTDSFVQAVNLHGLLQNLPVTPGKEFKVGKDSRQIVISESGARLYITSVDDLTKPAVGGVAIVEASEQACEEILWRHLDGCPHCDTPNCVVLATITDYHIDRAIDDANINNRTRRLLPSTEILKEYIECLREHGPGGVGQQGPPGDRGNDGLKGDPGLDNVNLRLVDCGQPGSATIVTDNQGKRTLELIIPSGCQTDLTHICGINWTHQRENPRTLFTDRDAGLLIAFDSPVRSRDLHEHSFIVLARRREDRGPICWCEIPGRIEPGDFDVRCDLTSRFVPNQNARVNGVRFVPGVSLDNLEKEFRVILKGDYIRGFKDKGLDADHLPPWFNQANYHSGDGIEGGTFESWFTIEG